MIYTLLHVQHTEQHKKLLPTTVAAVPQTCLNDNTAIVIQSKLPLLPESQLKPKTFLTATLDMLYKVHTAT